MTKLIVVFRNFANAPENVFRIPAGARDLSVLQSVQTGSGTHQSPIPQAVEKASPAGRE
jgi:hypothetical protein